MSSSGSSSSTSTSSSSSSTTAVDVSPPFTLSVIEYARCRLAAHASSGRRAPFVTLTYAQSLDGSITHVKGEQLKLSSHASFVMTHTLRSMHKGIVVGVGTILGDDPSLTTRFIVGPSPHPIILDSSLQTPITSQVVARHAVVCCTDQGLTHQQQLLATPQYVKQRLRQLTEQTTTTTTTTTASPATQSSTTTSTPASTTTSQSQSSSTPSSRFDALVAAGALPLICPSMSTARTSTSTSTSICDSNNSNSNNNSNASPSISLAETLPLLGSLFPTLMVEGGARVITSMLERAEQGICDQLIITIAPMLVGGYRPLSSPLPSLPRLAHVVYSQADDDIIVAGHFHDHPHSHSPDNSPAQADTETPNA